MDNTDNMDNADNAKKSVRRGVGAKIALALTLLLIPSICAAAFFARRTATSAWTLLFAARRNGIEPSAFYVTGTTRVRAYEASARLAAARLTLAGIRDCEARVNASQSDAVITVSITCEPSVWQAEEYCRLIQSTLGRGAELSVCLVGGRTRGNDAPEFEDLEIARRITVDLGDTPNNAIARPLFNSLDNPLVSPPINLVNFGGNQSVDLGQKYVSVDGFFSQTAIRRNGETLIGIPLIPLDY